MQRVFGSIGEFSLFVSPVQIGVFSLCRNGKLLGLT